MLSDLIIDFHTHIGRLFFSHRVFTARKLLKRMDELGVSRAVVLPIENPEETVFYVTTETVLRAAKRYPERLIPFCNVDPRRGDPETFDPYPIIEEYVSRGCVGFGEELAGLKIDDYRLQRIYEAVGKLRLPIVMHLDAYRNVDEVGLPRFENMIKKYPKTIFVAHGPHWWAEISGNVKREDLSSYPKGPVTPGGKVDYLLKKYANLYADLSADSGFNALARDPKYAKEFLERNSGKLLFGTDLLYESQEIKILKFLEDINLSTKAYERILHRNAEKLISMNL